MILPDHFKLTGREVSVEPPEGKLLPPCARCFEIPTRALLITPDLASKMRARVHGVQLADHAISLRPCNHVTWVARTDLIEVACRLIGADPGEIPEPAPPQKPKKRKKRR